MWEETIHVGSCLCCYGSLRHSEDVTLPLRQMRAWRRWSFALFRFKISFALKISADVMGVAATHHWRWVGWFGWWIHLNLHLHIKCCLHCSYFIACTSHFFDDGMCYDVSEARKVAWNRQVEWYLNIQEAIKTHCDCIILIVHKEMLPTARHVMYLLFEISLKRHHIGTQVDGEIFT